MRIVGGALLGLIGGYIIGIVVAFIIGQTVGMLTDSSSIFAGLRYVAWAGALAGAVVTPLVLLRLDRNR